MTEPARPALSVVVPCYNEESVLPEFLRRTGAVLDAATGTSELVLVDDGSRDGTWALMADAAAADSRIVAVRLMRNHGHQLALTAGLTAAGLDGGIALSAVLLYRLVTFWIPTVPGYWAFTYLTKRGAL